jgi:hypothetical protein
LLEDLTVCSGQLAGTLQDTADVLSLTPSPDAQLSMAAEIVVYGPRVNAAVDLLRRAEGWLDALDRATDAPTTLPGFAPRAPSLESQLNLP